MSSSKSRTRATAKAVLKTVGLLPVAKRVANAFRPSDHAGYERRLRDLRRQYGHVLGQPLNNPNKPQRVALVYSPGFPEAEIELGLIKALQIANFVPVVIIPYDGPIAPLLAEHYRIAAVDNIHHWREFSVDIDSAVAEATVAPCKSLLDLLEFEYADVRVGRLAVSTVLRSTYRGSLDLQVPADRKLLTNALANGMAAAKAAQNIIHKFQPDLALFVDTTYSPTGELFDACLHNRVEAIQWQQGHKSNALIFKRYTRESWLDHPSSLSPASWQLVRGMEWSDDHSKQLDRELYSAYASGDWYSVVGTQFNTSIVDSAYLHQRFGLDPNKKTVVLFPHILWDATLFWVKCLFRDFEEWLVETVRAACANDTVNWVIKIHPANRRLREEGSLQGESAEVVALNKYIGKLPPHIVMVPPESEVSTYSLFQIMDACLTVCGTVGMEAARLGIPVVNARSAHYDHNGYTVDSNTREEYLEKLSNIQSIPRLSSAQQELAERFAYANFLMRPWQAKSVTLKYLPHKKKFLYEGRVNIKSKEDWYAAEDLKAFAEWVANPNKSEEYLAQLPQPCRVGE
jgi:hypothetical protein